MKRRVFLQQMTGLANLLYLPGCQPFKSEPARNKDYGRPAAVWRTLAALHAHLLPSEPDAPGAAELHSLDYLKALLSIPQLPAAERTALIHGAEILDSRSLAQTGQPFAELPEVWRERVLRDFEMDKKGRAWLETQLHYLLEALLSDPVYGGNPDGVGWRWLAHNPGFPRPPADKRWFLLESV
ncbi:MAG: gluconate 2-dehydrogenase subunit 3 family protein [Thioploca sp.]|nr:gluconate 2-dehydrogenase subunit 3 family protein [Thioploca sp.]